MIRSEDVGAAWKSVPWNRVFGGEVVADRLFLRSALIRKDLLPLYAGASMPRTYAVHSAEDAEAVEGGGALTLSDNGRTWPAATAPAWVVKPADSSNAFGVRFCGEGELGKSVSAALREDMELRAGGGMPIKEDAVWIAQRAVDSWTLYGGHKFHVRVLVIVVGDLDLFVYDDGRVLVAPLPATSSADPHAHVTNRSFNKDHKAYDAATHNVALRDCEPLARGGDEPKADWPRGGVLRQVRDIVAKIGEKLAAHQKDQQRRDTANAPPLPPPGEKNGDDGGGSGDGASSPSSKNKARRHFFALPNTWELFGLDFMVDVDRRVVLLEANPEPSMDMWGGLTKQQILRDKCPITDGVPRSNDTSLGFTKAYSKRFAAALAAMKEQRAAAAAAASGNKSHDQQTTTTTATTTAATTTTTTPPASSSSSSSSSS